MHEIFLKTEKLNLKIYRSDMSLLENVLTGIIKNLPSILHSQFCFYSNQNTNKLQKFIIEIGPNDEKKIYKFCAHLWV